MELWRRNADGSGDRVLGFRDIPLVTLKGTVEQWWGLSTGGQRGKSVGRVKLCVTALDDETDATASDDDMVVDGILLRASATSMG